MTEATLLISSRVPIDGWQRATIMMDVASQRVFSKYGPPQLTWNASQLKVVGPLRLTPLLRLVLRLSPTAGSRILEQVKEHKLRNLQQMWPATMKVSANWGESSETSWREATVSNDYEDSGARPAGRLKVGAL